MCYKEFLDFLKRSEQEIFIEAEGKEKRLIRFISEYNCNHNQSIQIRTEGLCTLNDNVDKWGLELRIYLNCINTMPAYWMKRKYNNTKYRSVDFKYRIDDNNLVEYLLNNKYTIGYNL